MKTPHKHAEMIKAWAEGETIEFRNAKTKNWAANCGSPNWYTDTDYRVKPEAKLPDLPAPISFSPIKVQLACLEYGEQCFDAGVVYANKIR